MGTNGLIGAIVAPLGDCFLGNSFEILLKKVFNFFLNIKKINLYRILLRFVLKNCQEYVIFKVFQVHLQLKKMVAGPFTLFLKVQMLMK
jgi:hypothetical protein